MSWLCGENKFGDTALGSPEPCVNARMPVFRDHFFRMLFISRLFICCLLQLIRLYRPAVYNMHYRQKGDDTADGDQTLPLVLWGVRAELSTTLSTEYWGWAAFQSKMCQIVLVKIMKSQRKIEGDSRGFFSMLNQTRPLALKLGAV